MNEVQSTINQLQQLFVSERKNRLKIESQLSIAQDHIGAIERRVNCYNKKIVA